MHEIVADITKRTILGRWGENAVTTIKFPIAQWRAEVGEGGEFVLNNMRPTDSIPYPCENFYEKDGYVCWVPSSTDLKYKGNGQCELTYVLGHRIAKSAIFPTLVLDALDVESSEAPDPYQSWMERMDSIVLSKQNKLTAGDGIHLTEDTVEQTSVISSDIVMLEPQSPNEVTPEVFDYAVNLYKSGKVVAFYRKLNKHMSYACSHSNPTKNAETGVTTETLCFVRYGYTDYSKVDDVTELTYFYIDRWYKTTAPGQAPAVNITSVVYKMSSDPLRELGNTTGYIPSDKVVSQALAKKQDILKPGTNIKIENNVISAFGGGSGGTEMFFAIFNETPYEDVKQAIIDGKQVYAVYNNLLCTYVGQSRSMPYDIDSDLDSYVFRFVCIDGTIHGDFTSYLVRISSRKGETFYTEHESNIINDNMLVLYSGDEEYTDEEIFTAKAVLDAIDDKIANIPSAKGYSMEEQDTGLTWIDGKKIYQKTVDVPLGRDYESKINHGISNFNELISIEGTVLTVDPTRGNLYRSFPFVYSGNGGTNYTISIFDFDKTSFMFVRGSAYYSNNTNIGGKFTFRYTKTTD